MCAKGAQIFAEGTADAPIIFTFEADPKFNSKFYPGMVVQQTFHLDSICRSGVNFYLFVTVVLRFAGNEINATLGGVQTN